MKPTCLKLPLSLSLAFFSVATQAAAPPSTAPQTTSSSPELVQRSQVSILDFLTLSEKQGTNSVNACPDVTLAIQKAINVLGSMTHGSPYHSGFVPGGGVITFPAGTYKVTDTLLVPGGITFRGDGSLSSMILFTPTQGKPFVKGDPSKHSRNQSWDRIVFENLAISGGPNGRNIGSTCFDFSNVQRWYIQHCLVESFGTGLTSGGESYYGCIDNSEFYNNQLHINHVSGNPITVIGGSFFNYGGEFPTNKPNYMIYTNGEISFHGTAIEPTNAVQSPNSFVCIKCGPKGNINIFGGYSESDFPLVEIDYQNSYYTKTNIQMLAPHALPLIRFVNFDSSNDNSILTNNDAFANHYGVSLGDSPQRLLNIWDNQNFLKGAFNWRIGDPTRMELREMPAAPQGKGCLSLTMETGLPDHTTLLSRTVPPDQLKSLDGKRLFVAFVVKFQESLREGRCQILQGIRYKVATPYVDYGNGFKLYLADLGIDAKVPLDISIRAGGSGSILVNAIVPYMEGVDLLPMPLKETYSASMLPTTGTWERGDIVFNSAPASGGNIGWVCVGQGTPGIWKPFGTIQ